VARFGDGLAVGPDLDHAAESAVEQACADLSGPPDVLFVFACGDNPESVAAAQRRVAATSPAQVVVGCSATGVIGGNRGVEETSAVSVWAGRLPGARLSPFHLDTLRTEDQLVVAGMPERRADDVAAVLLADPYTFPVDAFVERSDAALGGLPLIGGLSTGMHGRGSARMLASGEVVESGAVGLMIGGPVRAEAIVSQGSRPIGPTMAITNAIDNVVFELAGEPALTRLEQVVGELSPEDQRLARQGLLIGIAIDEYADEHERGDFLVRGVIGADSGSGALAIGDVVEVGRTVRFQVRDALTAEEDLAEMLARHRSGANGSAEGALLFCCNGRGSAMFPTADHDVRAVRRLLGVGGVGGFFASGEIGPVGGRNHVHGFTASILAFGREAPKAARKRAGGQPRSRQVPPHEGQAPADEGE
jgi:small ligand-binding sensory domain FIST